MPSVEDPEDILSSSLQTLYQYQPITLTSAGTEFTYTYPFPDRLEQVVPSSSYDKEDLRHGVPITIMVNTPDTQSANWSLHASSIWMASIFLANNIHRLNLKHYFTPPHRSNAHPMIPNQPLCSPSHPGPQALNEAQISRTPTSLNPYQAHPNTPSFIRVLELGAGAGIPSILLAKVCLRLRIREVQVMVSDYPDKELIKALSDNVDRNMESNSGHNDDDDHHDGIRVPVDVNCCVVPYAWGTDPGKLLNATSGLRSRAKFMPSLAGPDGPTDGRLISLEGNIGGEQKGGFDIVMAADTLWNSALHEPFLTTLCRVLKKSASARIHLVAGLHTGRYTLEAFLKAVGKVGLIVESAVEYEVAGDGERNWDVSREDDETERRGWVVWMVLKWRISHDPCCNNDSCGASITIRA
ncbi:hypothetical protein BDN72DRAFT_846902 [Pluteus cervinus]|uniref:Uncharacterized protein n=1 Tax=Pluteus cervinus TaxID=181527 RepID=A0ACD3AES6_9AGAR|nr:hypothetical protein BDN72DRAFT_846902 [Pluteus cervinus]